MLCHFDMKSGACTLHAPQSSHSKIIQDFAQVISLPGGVSLWDEGSDIQLARNASTSS